VRRWTLPKDYLMSFPNRWRPLVESSAGSPYGIIEKRSEACRLFFLCAVSVDDG
jgi:hypothetical protein